MTPKEKLEQLGWDITKKQYHLEFNNYHLNVMYWWLNKTIDISGYVLNEYEMHINKEYITIIKEQENDK